MNKKRWLELVASKKVAPLVALVITAGTFGSTMAYYNGFQSLGNPLKTSHSGAAIVEEFNPDSSFLPGETVVKKVAFKNTGKMDIFLRVEVPADEGWYYINGEGNNRYQEKEEKTEGDFLNTENVIKHWNVTWPGDDETASTDDWTEVITSQNGKKYRYYKRILAKEAVTCDILDTIELKPVSNDRHDIDYSDKVYKLTFNAEAVPVEDHGGQIGVQAEWGMNVTDDGNGRLTWVPSPTSTD